MLLSLRRIFLLRFLVLFGIKYSSRPADKNHPYGHGRAEPLIHLYSGYFLITSATIAYESISNIQTPHELPQLWTLLVLGAIII
jgi:divalent metal cation (Fe/Co/Zn/Cd) transporter